MNDFDFSVSKKDKAYIDKIVEIAEEKKLLQDDKTALMMDIIVAHKQFALNLEKLLEQGESEDIDILFDYVHDIVGIQHHINRETYKIEKFVPRCARC